MKKILILAIIVLVLFSCSKSENKDTATAQLTPTYQTMAGDWEFVTIVHTNDSQIAYPHKCTTKKDFIHIITNTKISVYYNQTDCTTQIDGSCDGYYFDGNIIKNCNNFNDAKIISLTATTLQVQFSSPDFFAAIPTAAKGVIFRKL